jgi:hypothetical protein
MSAALPAGKVGVGRPFFSVPTTIRSAKKEVGIGECNYYLKARFSTAEEAAAAVPRLSELLGQGEAARDYWQNARPSLLPDSPRQPPSAEEY